MLIIITINWNSDWSYQFFKQIAYLTSSWRFHRGIVFEILKLKNNGIQKSSGKVKKNLWNLAISPKQKHWGRGFQGVAFRRWSSGGGLQEVVFRALPFDFSVKFLPGLSRVWPTLEFGLSKLDLKGVALWVGPFDFQHIH